MIHSGGSTLRISQPKQKLAILGNLGWEELDGDEIITVGVDGFKNL